MNLKHNHRINSSIIKTSNKNLKVMSMGILLIAATFLVASNNANVSAAFAQKDNRIAGCAHVVNVTISGLPKQRDDSNTQVTLSNFSPNEDKGEANINIPGIGSGHVFVAYILNSNTYFALISDIPGQNGPSFSDGISAANVCSTSSPHFVFLNIPGNVGSGSLAINKVN